LVRFWLQDEYEAKPVDFSRLLKNIQILLTSKALAEDITIQPADIMPDHETF
jgi:hypothetical protein